MPVISWRLTVSRGEPGDLSGRLSLRSRENATQTPARTVVPTAAILHWAAPGPSMLAVNGRGALTVYAPASSCTLTPVASAACSAAVVQRLAFCSRPLPSDPFSAGNEQALGYRLLGRRGCHPRRAVALLQRPTTPNTPALRSQAAASHPHSRGWGTDAGTPRLA